MNTSNLLFKKIIHGGRDEFDKYVKEKNKIYFKDHKA